jgi:formylglycine-generating enzyme required for sulfatase activity
MSSSGSKSTVLPEQFGPYRIVRPLGKGGMGTVYLARDTRLDRDVALKVCNLGDNKQALERFRREAMAASTLRHTNLCPVYEFDVRDGIAYLTMGYIEGPTLADWLRGRTLSQRDAAMLVRKLAIAMQTAHEAGIVHRDLKPPNIVIDKQNEPVILDFGLARNLIVASPLLTQDGAIYGTPSYMAPEQAGGDPKLIGPACDIYALGAILYELLTGEVPFKGPTMAVLGQLLHAMPVPPRTKNSTIDPALEATCLKALAKKPEDRQKTMKDLALELTKAARTAMPALPGVMPPPPPAATATVPHRASAIPPPPPAPAPNRAAAMPPPAPPTIPNHAADTTAPRRKPTAIRTKTKELPKPSGSGLFVLMILLLVAGLGAAGWYGYQAWRARQKSTNGGPEAKGEHKEFINGLGMRMAYIEPGNFRMGSPGIEQGHQPGETPRLVTLTKGFYLSATLVTQKQWKDIMSKNPSKFIGDDLPVDSVSWDDCKNFCAKLSAKEGKTYRLPTEAEWEYACRAGTATPFWTGETITTAQANINGTEPYLSTDKPGTFRNKTTPVTQFAANPWGLHDMHGNLWQWCADWFGDYDKGDTTDPHGANDGVARVLRGGSWNSTAAKSRAAERNGGTQGNGAINFGCRVAMSVAP